MRVKINEKTIKRLLDIDRKIKNLQKEMKLILEVYGDAMNMKGNLSLDSNSWTLFDSRPEHKEDKIPETMEVDVYE